MFAADAFGQSRSTGRLTLASVNEASFAEPKGKGPHAVFVKAQVLLNRAGFSPGAIDGVWGENAAKALRAFQRHSGLAETDKLDEASWKKLTEADSGPVLSEYQISAIDVKGPFVKKIPLKMEDMAALKSLGYRDAGELLAERFHMDDDLLKALNPKVGFGSAGTRITVASVRTNDRKARVAKVQVDKKEASVRALAEDGGLIAYFPATIGSEEKPAPSGALEVRAIARNPKYTYNPEFNFKGVKAKEPFDIAPGPNNPVGSVWIGLSKESYGIHGTPEPSKVSKTASHGCVRLTNWDALALASMVRKGVPVEFID